MAELVHEPVHNGCGCVLVIVRPAVSQLVHQNVHNRWRTVGVVLTRTLVRNCQELLRIVTNCRELSRIVANCHELSGIVANCHEFLVLKIERTPLRTLDYLGLCTSSAHDVGLSRDVGLSWIIDLCEHWVRPKVVLDS